MSVKKSDENTEVKVNKWDAQTVKNILDDTIRKLLNKRNSWVERHTIMNLRLVISTVAVAFSIFGYAYDYFMTFQNSKAVLATCSISYFVLMGVLQLYVWYVEKGIFYQAVEQDFRKRTPERYWKWSSSLKKFDDKYQLEAEYTQESLSGHTKVVKSIGCFIDEEGSVVNHLIEKEIDHLISSMLRKE